MVGMTEIRLERVEMTGEFKGPVSINIDLDGIPGSLRDEFINSFTAGDTMSIKANSRIIKAKVINTIRVKSELLVDIEIYF